MEGIHGGNAPAAAKSVGTVEVPYEQFAERLEPLLCAPYAEACRGVSRANWLGAVFASGAMYCTLLTRCWYKHFDGGIQRMNPQVLIIGHPASGKSFAKHLDDQIMCSMRAQDEGRDTLQAGTEEERHLQQGSEAGRAGGARGHDTLLAHEDIEQYLLSSSETCQGDGQRRAATAAPVYVRLGAGLQHLCAEWWCVDWQARFGTEGIPQRA